MIGAEVYMIVFRLLHIGSAIAWGGSVFLFVVFLQPASAAIAPAGAPLMMELLDKRRLVDRIVMLGSLTVLGGLFLYWHDWHAYGGFSNFVGTAFGTAITFGAISAIAALLLGVLGTRPTLQRFLGMAKAAAAAGGPTPEQQAEMGRIQGRLKVLARGNLALIGLAVIGMSTARYW